MSRYVIRRLLLFIPTILGIYTLTFVMTHILPGDPASFLLGPRDDVQPLPNKRHAMGLDQPLPVQYVTFLKSAFQGDLAQTYRTLQPVTRTSPNEFPSTSY